MFLFRALFLGWRTGTLGRARFLVCAVTVAVLIAISIQMVLVIMYSEHTSLVFKWTFWLMLFWSYYSGLLIVIKRFRQLVAYPVVWALAWWGGLLFLQRFSWRDDLQYIQMGVLLMSLLVFGLLLCAPARRGEAINRKA